MSAARSTLPASSIQCCALVANRVEVEAMTESTPAFDLGREIRRRREAMGMTLEVLADRAGLTPNYIGTIENGQRNPSLSTLDKLARGLGIHTGNFFSTTGSFTAAAEEVGRLFDGAQPAVQEAILIILHTLNTPQPPESSG
jgi:transcriptional regulator with XRE-family HTH domain